MKRITFSADAHLIQAARERAREENTTVSEQFRRWLADYVDDNKAPAQLTTTDRPAATRQR